MSSQPSTSIGYQQHFFFNPLRHSNMNSIAFFNEVEPSNTKNIPAKFYGVIMRFVGIINSLNYSIATNPIISAVFQPIMQ
ncbi:MAG: hypothetical protein EZS28_041583, partial [Streblomastix strix]